LDKEAEELQAEHQKSTYYSEVPKEIIRMRIAKFFEAQLVIILGMH